MTHQVNHYWTAQVSSKVAVSFVLFYGKIFSQISQVQAYLADLGKCFTIECDVYIEELILVYLQRVDKLILLSDSAADASLLWQSNDCKSVKN